MQEITLLPFGYKSENNLPSTDFSTIAKFTEFSKFFEENFGSFQQRKSIDFSRQVFRFFFLLANKTIDKKDNFAFDYYLKQLKEKSNFVTEEFLTRYNSLTNNSQRLHALSSNLNNALEENNFPLTLCYIPLCYGNNFMISLELNAKYQNGTSRIFTNAILSHSESSQSTKHYLLPNLLDDFLTDENTLYKALSKFDWLEIALPKTPIKISSKPLNCGFSICDFGDFFTLLENNKTLLTLLPSFLK